MHTPFDVLIKMTKGIGHDYLTNVVNYQSIDEVSQYFGPHLQRDRNFRYTKRVNCLQSAVKRIVVTFAFRTSYCSMVIRRLACD